MMMNSSFRLFILSFGVGIALLPFQAFAQVGPCSGSPPTTCPSGQTCINPPEGAPMCFKTCTPAVVGSSPTEPSCPDGLSCGDIGGGVTVCQRLELEGATMDYPALMETSPSTPTAIPATTQPAAPFVSITPHLNIDIPGVELTPAVKSGESVYIPFLSQYISGVYRYAVGIVLVIAIVMVAWGGFRYLLGSSFEDVSRGKEIIRDALAGMLLVIGAYLILQTINPATLNLSVLKLGNVTEQAITLSQNTTTVDTRPEGSYADTPSAPSVGSSYAGASFGECPVVLDTPVDQTASRRTEYLGKIGARVGTGDIRDRVLRVAEASAKCGVSLGSCGKTASTIFAAAGQHYSDARGHQTHHEPAGITTFLNGIKCDSGLSRSEHRTCVHNAQLQAWNRMSHDVPGWPEVWTNDLLPGDRIVIFNANSSLAGLHSVVFMGWAGSGRARVVQGAFRKLVNEGTICLTSACTNCLTSVCTNPSPLIRVFEPMDH